jgi:hypothetical protein
MTRIDELIREQSMDDLASTSEWNKPHDFAEIESPQGQGEKDIETKIDALKTRLKNGEGLASLNTDIQRLKGEILDHIDFFGTDSMRPSIAQGYSWLEAIQIET